MDGSGEALCECILVCDFKDFTLKIASCGLWVVLLHEFGEILGEVSRWGMCRVVLRVEPFAFIRG
jgi:hypothetical protein